MSWTNYCGLPISLFLSPNVKVQTMGWLHICCSQTMEQVTHQYSLLLLSLLLLILLILIIIYLEWLSMHCSTVTVYSLLLLLIFLYNCFILVISWCKALWIPPGCAIWINFDWLMQYKHNESYPSYHYEESLHKWQHMFSKTIYDMAFKKCNTAIISKFEIWFHNPLCLQCFSLNALCLFTVAGFVVFTTHTS